MKEKLEVGQVWIGKTTKVKKQILAIGESAIFFKALNSLNEDVYSKDCFIDDHTLKKPEPKLTKLVAWVSSSSGMVNSICFENDPVFKNNINFIAKPIIIKDGELFVSED